MRCKLSKGFTVVEVMVALVILAILAALAFPAYQESVLKTKRAEGRAALMKTMQQQERYYSLHTTYLLFSAASTDAEAKKFNWFSGENAQASAYEVSAQACKDETIRACVRLIAQPGTGRVNPHYRDPRCGTLSLSSTGEKSADAQHCW